MLLAPVSHVSQGHWAFEFCILRK